jgi:hypothetical protein
MTHKQIDPCYDCGADMGGAIMKTYKLYTYDLWGNAKDGYTINDYYGQDTFELDSKLTDKEIFRLIGIKPQSQNHVMFDNGISDDSCLYVVSKKDYRPVCELREIVS